MEPWIETRLEKDAWCGGETLRGTVRLGNISQDDVKAAEALVMWFTEGKGDTDAAIVATVPIDPRGAGTPISATLPLLPLSYQGGLLKLLWTVRVRIDMRRGKDIIEDRFFTVVAPVDAAG